MTDMKETFTLSKERMPVSGRTGPVLMQLREALEIKQADAASLACLSPVAVSRMENGLTCSAADNYEREAAALGLDYALVISLAAALAQRNAFVLTRQEIALALASRRL